MWGERTAFISQLRFECLGRVSVSTVSDLLTSAHMQTVEEGTLLSDWCWGFFCFFFLLRIPFSVEFTTLCSTS